MKADVDVHDGAGDARLPQMASVAASWSTPVFEASDTYAAARVQAIIAATSRSRRGRWRRTRAPAPLLAGAPAASQRCIDGARAARRSDGDPGS